MCRFIWEWIYAKQIPFGTQGGILGFFRGSQFQMSWEAVKLLDRLAPNLVHVCGFIWEWTWLNKTRPSIPQGAFLGFYGVTNLSLGKLPNGWTDWHHIRYTSVDSSENGHRLKTIRPTIPHGVGGFRGSTFQKPGKCGQAAGPIGNTFCTYNAGESEWTQVEQIGPMKHQGVHFDAGLSRGNVLGFKGVNISSKSVECTKVCVNRHNYAAMIPSEAG